MREKLKCGQAEKLKWAGTVLALVSAFQIFSLSAFGNDLTTGYTFASGEKNITHTKLNNAINNAIINPGFFTDKSAYTTPLAADTVLIYSSAAGGLRKMTLGNLLLTQPLLITSQTEDTAPATGDFVLTYDISDTGLKKATLDNLVFRNLALISNRTNYSTPGASMFFLGYDGEWSKVARSNLWYQFWNYRTADFTNLATCSSPTNNDALVIWDSDAGTNRQLPLINLYSNANFASSIASTDALPAVVAGQVATVTVGKLATAVSNINLTATFTSFESNLVAGSVCHVAHGLGAAPGLVRWVLVCKTNDAATAYVVGDELDVGGTANSVPRFQFTGGANSTNVFLAAKDTTLVLAHKTSGAETAATTSLNFRAKCYARP